MKFSKGQIPWNKGLTAKDDIRVKYSTDKMHAIHRGQPSWNKGVKGYLAGKRHYAWKGDEVGYFALHAWIKRTYGKATKCENSTCIYPRFNSRGLYYIAPKGYNWANISHKYKRDRSDWIQLCISCHMKYDRGLIVLQ